LYCEALSINLIFLVGRFRNDVVTASEVDDPDRDTRRLGDF